MTALIFIIIFLVSWIFLLINWFLVLNAKIKIKRRLKVIKTDIKFKNNDINILMDLSLLENILKSKLKIFLSFGSKTEIKKSLYLYTNINKLEEIEDNEMNKLLTRLYTLTGKFTKIWTIMMISLLLAFIFWPN